MQSGGARVGNVRSANLAGILRLVHERGPLSRAALTEATGLNRSTVADLVGVLAAEGLVEEGAPAVIGRAGRPSPVVAPHPRAVAIAVNPEVDAVEIAAVALGRTIVARERIPADAPRPGEVVTLVAEWIARARTGALSGHRLLGLGVAVPGLVRSGDGRVRRAPHLDWHDVPLRDLLADATGLAVAVDNDAALGLLAESRFGAARDIRDAVYLNGGASGIGGALLIGGTLVTGAGGYAGEFGHNRPAGVAAEDRRVADGALEDEVNRARLLDALDLPAADDATLAAALASTRDPAARAEAARQRRILATSLVSLVNAVNPAAIVLGGFLAALGTDDPQFLHAVRAGALAEPGEALRIVPAALAADRLLIGAAELALAPVLTRA